MMETAHTRALLVGDTHGNDAWFVKSVLPTALRNNCSLVIQLGDFGYWQHSTSFLDKTASGLDDWGIEVWFLDGNHEQWPLLLSDVATRRAQLELDHAARVPLRGGLSYLPRGARFELGSVSVVACGGAASIDRGLRHPGIDWFLEERIDEQDLENVATAGQAQVLLAHDAPAGHVIPGLLPDHKLPPAWRAERPACEEHRLRLLEAYEQIRPELVVHGHYHLRYTLDREEQWGKVRIEGLACDGLAPPVSMLVLDTSDGTPNVSRPD